MTQITITLKKKIKYRIDMSFISKIQDSKSVKHFLSKKIYYGNKPIEVAKLFNISGSDMSKIVIKSAVNLMDNIGKELQDTEMTVFGNVGFSFGSGMQSGTLNLHGNCLDYAASGMRSGKIFINGNTGDHLGGKPNAANEGILDGFIYVKGNVGQNSIQRMRRGNVVINGNLGDYACEEMISGTVVIMGNVGNSFAEGMKRGTIVTKEKKLIKDYKIANDAEYNFIDFFITKISKILNRNIFNRKHIVSRYHGHKDKDNISEVFLFKS